MTAKCSNKFLDEDGNCSMCGKNHLVGQKKRSSKVVWGGKEFQRKAAPVVHKAEDYHPTYKSLEEVEW